MRKQSRFSNAFIFHIATFKALFKAADSPGLWYNPHMIFFHPPVNLQKICKDLRHTHELTVPRLFQIIGMLGKVTQAVKIKHILERTSLLHCLQEQRHHTVKVGRTERARIRTLFSPCNTLRQNIAERFAQDTLFPAVQTL